ncbi:UNVERIFIED_CONTAM: hypothetical protein RMT77_008006 [Armadillidium vulgare]
MCGPQKTKHWATGSLLGAPGSPIPVFKNFSRGVIISWSFLIITVVLLLQFASGASAGLVLSDHIKHFEPVFFDSSALRLHHHRAKRDANHVVSLDFTAHSRVFKIRLQRDSSIFADDVAFESTDGVIDFDVGKVYSGTLEDDDQVDVHGILSQDGLFDGHISTPNELFYVEPAHRYFSSPAFHTVMYKASDVLHPRPARCASQQLHIRGRVHNPWVKNTRDGDSPPEEVDSTGVFYEPSGQVLLGPSEERSTPDDKPLRNYFSSNTSKKINYHSDEGEQHRRLHPKFKAVKSSTNNKLYSASDIKKNKEAPHFERASEDAKKAHYSSIPNINLNTLSYLYENSSTQSHPSSTPAKHNNLSENTFSPNSSYKRRYKRSVIDPKKTTCMLYLQADHLFFKQEGTEEACIDKITRHVQRVNNIYKVTDFDRDGKEDHIGFMIKRIKIHNENATRDPTYRFPGNYGVEKFLELFSEEDYDAFCLAYMFTYRDFEGGTLGLAWTGDLKNAGGVCEKNGHYRGSLKSLNTGIVTLLNYGKKVPPAVSHVTLAHEIGHNFGSPHDPEKDINCTPGGENGNYIMFARATSGDKQNNNKFSPCSLKQINSVLNSKARDAKGCFTEPQRAICGNGVVEEGEECDCGWQEDCEESCCYPMVTNHPRNHKPCTLRPGKICSPSQGPCCTKDCSLKQGDLCREDNGCRDASFCGGSSPYCPPSINKPNKTICKDEFVCFKGECTGSICIAYGLDSCQCEREPGDPDTKSCELCCKLPGEDQPCLSSFDWNVPPFNIPDMYAKPGTPCDNYKGYCDVFQKCREVDPSGPLATLRKILLSNESLANLHRWLVDYWYALFFVIVALCIVLMAITRLFGRQARRHSSKKSHKKSSSSKKKKKKSKTIIHKSGTGSAGQFLTTANVNANNEGANHVVHPTVVRANIPFKRRVNEVRRAATKAKRVARSQLGRPCKKSGSSSKRAEASGAVTSPTDSEKSLNNPDSKVTSPSKTREKKAMSSRFSIISFKLRPKQLNQDKTKTNKVYDKRKVSIPGGRRSKSKGQNRSRSPDKKRKAFHSPTDPKDKDVRSRSPSKRLSLEDDKRKSKSKPYGPEMILRSVSPEKGRKHKVKSPEKSYKLPEGNWLINKFLADEEKLAKPIISGSIAGSLNGSMCSINGTANVSPVNGSPVSHTRHGSKRALIPAPNHASPIRGIVNEAFVGSPRNMRTHSSLRVTKSVSPEEKDMNSHLSSSKYRRSISMVAYNGQLQSPDKRKRSTIDEGSLDKRRRFSSPEKPIKLTSSNNSVEKENENDVGSGKERGKFSASFKSRPRGNSGSIPSSANSSNHSFVSVPDKIRQKLSLITASPEGSLTSIVVPEDDIQERVSDNVPKLPPKNWV